LASDKAEVRLAGHLELQVLGLDGQRH
jgi:hypothetical protein